jgi:hypothetical protein
MFNFDPYVTADTDLSEAEMDWSEFDPTIGTGALISAATLAHERSVYDADPTGGAASRY